MLDAPRWDRVSLYAFGLGSAVRGVWVLALHPPTDFLYSDMGAYVDRAVKIASGGPLGPADTLYPPGTHLLLSLPLMLLGVGRTGLWLGAVIWWALSCAAVFGLWCWTRRLFSARTAAVATILAAFYPLEITYAGYFMSETPALAGLMGLVAFSAIADTQQDCRRGLQWGILAGLAGGAMVIARPALGLNLLLAAIVLVASRRFAVTGGLVLAATLMVSVAIAHNSLATGHLTGVAQNGGLVFFEGQCDVNTVQSGNDETGTFAFEPPPAAQSGEGSTYNFPDHPAWDDRFYFEQGLSCVRTDGSGHVRLLLRHMLDMSFTSIPWPQVNEDGLNIVARASNVLYCLGIFFTVILTVRRIRRLWFIGGGRGEALALAHLSLVLLTAFLVFGDPRYREPYDFFGLALAAAVLAPTEPTRLRRQVPFSSSDYEPEQLEVGAP